MEEKVIEVFRIPRALVEDVNFGDDFSKRCEGGPERRS